MTRDRPFQGEPDIDRLLVLWRDERARYWAAFVACLAVCALTLWPTLHTGFMADDALNSLLTQRVLSAQHSSIWRFVGDFISSWARTQGRFFPLASYVYVLFWGVNGNLALYKAICLVAILVDVALFGILVTQLAGSRSLGLASMVASVVILQNTDFHDAILSFGTLLQVDFALVTGALILFLLYLRKREPWKLVLSVAIYVVALLTYEVIALLVVLFPLAAWMYGRRRTAREALRLTWPYLVAVGAAIAATLGLRLVFGSGVVASKATETYALSLSPIPFATTLAKQMFGAFPLSFMLARGATIATLSKQPFGSLAYDFQTYPLTSAVILIAIAVAFGLPLWDAVRRVGESSRPVQVPILIAFGAAYWVLPALLISLSPRWQRDLYWGAGYLPVYIEFFGVALVLLSAVYWLIRNVPAQRVRQLLVVAAALAIGLIGVVNFQNNRVMQAMDNASWNHPRVLLETALGNGLTQGVAARDTILTSDKAPFETKEFVFSQSGVMPNSVTALASFTPSDAVKAGMTSALAPDGQTGYAPKSGGPTMWCLESMSTGGNKGAVSLCRIKMLTFKGTVVSSAFVYPIRGFTFAPPQSSATNDTLRPIELPSGPAPTLQDLGIDDSNAKPISGTPEWTMYSLPGTQIVQVSED